MGSEKTEPEKQSTTPRLPLFTIPPLQSPERSGTLTPPLHTLASVPFRWEEEPGKPRPCTALVSFSKPTEHFPPKCLELPPRLLLDDKLSKLPSPTTVLEGPYVGSNRFRSPSCRMSTKDCYGSFRAEREQLGAMVLSRGGIKENGWFGSWRKKASKVKREVSGGGSHVFPSSADRGSDIGIIGGSHNRVKVNKMKRSGSFSSLNSSLNHTKSRVWTTICEGLKQVVPWRSKKLKKDGNGLGL